MKTLGLFSCAALLAAVALGGCGGRKSPTGAMDAGHDGGPPPSDAGIHDSGPTPDTGTITDSGSGGGMCPTGDCDLVGNGCAAGQSCYFLLASADAGMPMPLCDTSGTGMDGDACTNYTDCADGYFCLSTGAGTMGTCKHYCCGRSDGACPTGETCAVEFTDRMGHDTGVGYCQFPDTCDLAAQTGCPAGEACYPNGNDGSVLCIAPGTATEGQSCMAINECAGGLSCFGTGDGDGGVRNICMKLCDMAATPTGCATGQMCQSLGSSSAFGTIGVCSPPAGGDGGTGGGDAGTGG